MDLEGGGGRAGLDDLEVFSGAFEGLPCLRGGTGGAFESLLLLGFLLPGAGLVPIP